MTFVLLLIDNMVFVKDINSKEDIICPNCGAAIKPEDNNTCSYCKTLIYTNPKEFVMSKKTNIAQKRR